MTTRTALFLSRTLVLEKASRISSSIRSRSLYSTARGALATFGTENNGPFRFQHNQIRWSSLSSDEEREKKCTKKARRVKPFLLDLGIPSLIPEWKNMFNPKTLLPDITAGLTVGCIAVPLSLAIALASGVPAEMGLATAAVAGVAGGLMGGTTLAVTGPAAAISLLVVSAVEAHGLESLAFITLACGGLQMASGITRMGTFAKLVPVSVIAGFTTGVGTLILSGQIPKALGMAAPAGMNPFEMLIWLAQNIGDANMASAALAGGTAVSMLFLPKLHPKIPAALIAVGGATVATHTLGLDVAVIGTMPSGMDAFKFAVPTLPSMDSIPSLMASTLLIYSMTSVESLLSCVALEKMKKTSYKHNSDQELVGQGLANVAAGFFMGMPVTSVIARSGLNLRSGAQTRLPALVQSGFVFGSIAFASETISMVPMPALSGMLIVTGGNMLYPSEFNYCYSVDKFTTMPFFTTVAGMLSMGLAEGIGMGCLTALGLAVHKNMQLNIRLMVEETTGDNVYGYNEALECAKEKSSLLISPNSTVWQLRGPINFVSMFEIDSLTQDVKDERDLDSDDPVVLDMHNVTTLDFTGVEELAIRMLEIADDHAPVQMTNCSPTLLHVLNKVDPNYRIARSSTVLLEEKLKVV
mmetsp:Transcript_31486/g.46449  ORF Transcript_31486/g.46449 Transcript_31486/m.46449 type:complete len:639 (+) Transcript_31486:175-2091(+)